jgi:uncharacterized Ntn-hydrolase superfamily protein
MRKTLLSAVVLGGWLLLGGSSARATFSIVAVDPETGEVGSAGASCVTNANQISDVHPGVGAIHTQASNLWQNYVNASTHMDLGWSPQQIVDWLVAHDAQGTPSYRQYLIVDLVGGGRSAAYTGTDCDAWKGHRLGPVYAIGGNTLLGPTIVSAMESAFLNTGGSLAFRLMAAMQAANVPGADSRCASDGKPAVSAFLTVARPGDTPGDYFLELNVPDTTPDQNPIDILQAQFTAWATTDVPPDALVPAVQVANQPNPFNPTTEIRYWLDREEDVALGVFDLRGHEIRVLVDAIRPAGWNTVRWDGRDDAGRGVPTGEYFARVQTTSRAVSCRMMLVR